MFNLIMQIEEMSLYALHCKSMVDIQPKMFKEFLGIMNTNRYTKCCLLLFFSLKHVCLSICTSDYLLVGHFVVHNP